MGVCDIFWSVSLDMRGNRFPVIISEAVSFGSFGIKFNPRLEQSTVVFVQMHISHVPFEWHLIRTNMVGKRIVLSRQL